MSRCRRAGIQALLLGFLLLTAAAGATQYDVIINEINYSPFTGDEKDEFVELFNRGPHAVDLDGWSFSEGISFTFPHGSSLGPGEYLIAVPDAARAKARFGIQNVVGNYSGRLDNGGEVLALVNERGQIISRVHYLDGDFWPSNPDGIGPTLELVTPYEQNDLPQKWVTSLTLEGTPGRRNSRVTGGPADFGERSKTVVINEVRPTTPPGGNGFIELHNAGAVDVPVGGYAIIDSRGGKFVLPAATLAPGQRAAFGEVQLGFGPSLSARYALVQADGATWVDGINPSPAPAGSSFGRYPDGNEDQWVMTTPTQGAPNQLVLETSVVLNEVMYHPPFVAPADPCLANCSDPDQWIELYNRGPAAVVLDGWSLTKAVEFTVPAGTGLPSHEFLVIAADRARFLAQHPGVPPAKVVGGWAKRLSRGSDTINLRDALGNRVDHMKYGDGSPTNDINSTPPYGPGDGVDDRTLASSDWPPGADAPGRSLELLNPFLDRRAGASFRAGPPGGTPGAQNSSFDSTPPPVAFEVENDPAVPGSADPVRVTCRVSSVSPVTKVEVLWHLDPAGAVNTVQLLDDGLGEDKDAGDGVYSGSIPAQANKSTVAFQVRVQSQDGQTTVIPRSPEVAPYSGFEGPYYLYRVDNEPPPENGSVTYRLVMTAADFSALQAWYAQGGDQNRLLTDKLFHGTFVAGSAHHTVGIRVRGDSSRQDDRRAYRVDLPPERKFRGREHLNLVAASIQNELMVSDLFRRAGMPGMQEWAVNLVFQGVVDPHYVLKEDYDGDFLDRFFGGSAGGNLYRARDPGGGGGVPSGDLTYYGPVTDPSALALYQAAYQKKSNGEEADWSDVAELCRAFDPGQTPAGQFPAVIASLIDVDEWARFFAIQACVSNVDGAIETFTGEDYALYRVPASSTRPDAGKWLLLPWDIEETFSDPKERLFRPDLDAIKRFLRHPDFAPLYYANLIDLRDGAFSRREWRHQLYLIDRLFPASTVGAFDPYITARLAFFDDNVPRRLTAGASGSAAVKLIAAGETWKYWKGGQGEPSGGDLSWTHRTGFNDAAAGWLAGPTGIGYGDGDDQTVLDDMQQNLPADPGPDHPGYTTVYCRKTFALASDPALFPALTLSIDFDDGFVAFLNGQEVARRNVPGADGAFVPFDAVALSNHEAGTAVAIDITSFKNLLVQGTNVLAIQVLNAAINSTDLSMIPELLITGQTSAVGCGTTLFATGPFINLSGRADAGRTRSVEVNGAPVQHDGFTAQWSAAAVPLTGDLTPIRVEARDGTGASVEVMDLQVVHLVRSLTPLGGTLSSDTTWDAAGGPYLLAQTATVPPGVKLTIGAGAVIIGQSGASIVVRGVLEAAGTQDRPILLRAYSCDGRMGGIAIDSTGTSDASPQSELRFVDLELGQSPAGYPGTVSVVGSKVLVSDCGFRDLLSSAIDGSGARVEVQRSSFERIHDGVHATGSTVVVLDSAFREMSGDHDAIRFDHDGPGAERSRIERNLLEDGADDGLDLRAASVDIRDNTIREFADRAISLDGNGAGSPTAVTGNLVIDAATGIALKGGVTTDQCWHETVVGCEAGIDLTAESGAADGGHGAFHSMVVWGNLEEVRVDALSTAAFTESDLGVPWPGTGNLSADPRFAGPVQDDFSLLAGSPAIGAGRDGSDMGAIPFTGGGPPFIRGDFDLDGAIGLTDVIGGLDYLFLKGPAPACLDRLDANDDAGVDISDPIYLLFFLFADGAPPPRPFPGPGGDPTGDELPCE